MREKWDQVVFFIPYFEKKVKQSWEEKVKLWRVENKVDLLRQKEPVHVIASPMVPQLKMKLGTPAKCTVAAHKDKTLEEEKQPAHLGLSTVWNHISNSSSGS